MFGRKEENVLFNNALNTFYLQKEGRIFLFNDALNTFYLRLYGVGHMVKDHSDIKRGNPVPPHGLVFPFSSKGSFICTIPDSIATYHSFCYTSHGALAGTRNSSNNPSHHEQTLLPQSYISLHMRKEENFTMHSTHFIYDYIALDIW